MGVALLAIAIMVALGNGRQAQAGSLGKVLTCHVALAAWFMVNGRW